MSPRLAVLVQYPPVVSDEHAANVSGWVGGYSGPNENTTGGVPTSLTAYTTVSAVYHSDEVRDPIAQ